MFFLYIENNHPNWLSYNFQRGQCWVDYWRLSPNGFQVGHEPNVPHCKLQRMRWWFQLQPKSRSIFRFWINCVFYPKPESRWKQQLQFASGISFIMFPIKWLWLWVYPILKQTQLWPDGLSVRLLDAEHQILELRFEREQARKGRFHGFHCEGMDCSSNSQKFVTVLGLCPSFFSPFTTFGWSDIVLMAFSFLLRLGSAED